MHAAPPTVLLPNISEIEYVAAGAFFHNSAIIALYPLFLFDSLLLFDTELRLVLTKKWTWWTVLYVLCRYYPILVWPLYIWGWAQARDDETCNKVLQALYLLIIPLQASPQAVLIGRAWGYTQHNLLVLSVLLVSYMAFLGFQVWVYTNDLSISQGIWRSLGYAGCYRSYHAPVTFRVGCLMLASTAVDGSATMIIILYYILHYRKSPVKGMRLRLSTFFVRQGLTYFTLMITLNVTTAVLYFNVKSPYASIWFTSTMIMSNLFACRMILELYEFQYDENATRNERDLSELVRDGFERAADIEMETPQTTPLSQ